MLACHAAQSMPLSTAHITFCSLLAVIGAPLLTHVDVVGLVGAGVVGFARLLVVHVPLAQHALQHLQ